MKVHKLFASNQSQAVRIPKSMAFDDSVKEVIITRKGDSITITPKGLKADVWDDFFNSPPMTDFMPDGREQPEEQEREGFDD